MNHSFCMNELIDYYLNGLKKYSLILKLLIGDKNMRFYQDFIDLRILYLVPAVSLHHPPNEFIDLSPQVDMKD